MQDDVIGMVQYLLAAPGAPIDARLDQALRLLCKYRTGAIAAALGGEPPATVKAGPFAGMILPAEVSEGCYLPKLLGCYEQDLHAVVAGFAARDHQTVVNVGAAEGYYAVGLARLLPGVRVHAHDIDPEARRLCAEMAAANGVADRVRVEGAMTPADFAAFADTRTLVVCDIEGAETELLDPSAAPALLGVDLLVEVHDDIAPGTSATIIERFSSSHDVVVIQMGDRSLAEDVALPALGHLDRLLCTWEWRLAGNHWLWMTPR